ncbi:MAG: type II toxin-antitoxin system VapC family toxin [Candidatus Riflebacteria bacterium]|nr:type II toxin-antitoxin system VapC family toxin [Candidatus Riflebacteria bacterium]
MRLLLDTCTFLWLGDGHARLSEESRRLCTDPGNEVLISVVSAWEISVKHTLRRLLLSEPPPTYVPKYRKLHGIETLPLEEEAALQLHRLPGLHNDPFDRMLVCQAIVHGLTILTPDPLIIQYPVRTAW